MDEKALEKGDAYTMGFVVQKGGIETVAKRTGINRQTMRQVATGRNAPGFDFIMKMIAAYPDYDIRKSVPSKASSPVLAGDDDEPTSYADYAEVTNLVSVPSQVLLAENAGLKKEIARLEQTVDILQRVVSNQFGKDMESSKSESVNDPTRGKQLAIGLNWGVRKADSPMMKIPITSVRPMSRTWPTSMRLSSKR